jgi:hypothetical protein
MLNMLEYIRLNYGTHFKDLKIGDIENIDISLINYKDKTIDAQILDDTVSIFTGSEKTNQLSQKLTERNDSDGNTYSEIVRSSGKTQEGLEYEKAGKKLNGQRS